MRGVPDSYRESNHLHLVGSADDNLSRVIGDFKKFTTKRLIKRIETEPESRREWMLHQFKYAAKLDKWITNYSLWQLTSHPRPFGYARTRWRELHSRLLRIRIFNPIKYIFIFVNMNSIQNGINGEVFFVTTTVIDWIDIFTRPHYKHIIIDSLRHCQKEKGLIIYAWVLMSNHLHMIISSEVEGDISNIMRDFKKFTSKEIIKELKYDNQESRKEWMLNHFAYAAKNDKKIKDYKFWQDGIDAQGIYLESYFEQKINYIHNNPVKAEIVSRPEDYNYSSAVDYSGEKGLLDIVFA